MMLQNRPYWKNLGFYPNPDWPDGQQDEVDILIVGAGAAGLFAGIEFAKQKRKCYIIDSGIPGVRSSAKSDGILFSGPLRYVEPVQFYKLLSLSLESKKIFNKFNSCFTNSNWCEYSKMGGIRVAYSAQELQSLKDATEIYKKLELQAVHLTDASFRNITGVRYSAGAIFIPDEGMYNPLSLINGLVNTNRKLGNDVVSGITFYNFEELPNGKVLAIDIDGNVIQANKLILCLNAFSKHTPIKYLRTNVQPLRAQYIATKQISKAEISSIAPFVYSMNEGNDYFRIHNDRIIFGGGGNSPDLEPKELGLMADSKVNQNLTSILIGRMSFHVPFITPDILQPEFVWSRIITKTPDGLPIVGKLPNCENVYCHTGYDAHGISYIPIASKILSEVVCNTKTNIYGAELFSPERF